MSIDADLGAAWTEASRSFALEPVKFEMGGLFNATARASLANVPREVFSASAPRVMRAAAQIETGPIEFTVHDLGGIELLIAQYTRTHDVSRDDARQAIIQGLRDANTTEATQPRRGRAGQLCRDTGADACHQADPTRRNLAAPVDPASEIRADAGTDAIPNRGLGGAVTVGLLSRAGRDEQGSFLKARFERTG